MNRGIATHGLAVIPLLAALLPAAVWAGPQSRRNPFHGLAADIDTGRATFRVYCSPCHGIRAQGGRGPDLTLGVYEVGDGDEDLFEVIAQGVSGTEMPAFRGRLNEETIWRVVAYVRSVAHRETPALSGDASRGQQIYGRQGGCSACHRISAKGGRLGPDLSRVGRSRSLAYLRDALTAPNKVITPGYDTVSVQTRDGKTIQGRRLGVDNFSAQLMDSHEQIHSFLREEVRSIEWVRRSMMPSYESILSKGQIEDLLAYLVSLRGK